MNYRLKFAVLMTSSLLLSVAVPSLLKTSETVILRAFAQTPTSENRKAEADKLFQEGVQQYRRGEYPKALQTYNRVLEMRRQLEDKAGVGQTLNNIGQVYNGLVQQEKALEVLQQALLIRKEIKARVGEGETLDNIGGVYLALFKDEEALKTLQQALEIRREVKDKAGEAVTLSRLGLTYSYLKQQDKGLKLLQEALAIHKEVGDKFQEGLTLFRIAGAYDDREDYPNSLEWLNKALVVIREVGNRAWEGRSLIEIGLVYLNLKQYNSALKFFQQSLPLIQAAGIRNFEAIILSSIGDAYFQQKQYDQANKYYQQALPIAQEVKSKSLEANILKVMGNIYYNQKQYDRAIKFYQQALPIARQVKNKSLEADILAMIGVIYFEQKQYDQVIKFYQEALPVVREAKNQLQEANILTATGDVYFIQKQYDQAIIFYQQALALQRQSLNNRPAQLTILTQIMRAYNLSSIFAIKQKDYSRAINQANQVIILAPEALNISRELKQPEVEKQVLEIQSNAYSWIGNVYIELGDLQKAQEFAEQGLKIARQSQSLTATEIANLVLKIADTNKNIQLKLDSLIILKDIYIAQGNYQKALELLKQSLTTAKQNKNPMSEYNSLAYLAAFYMELGDYKQGIEFSQQALATSQIMKNSQVEGTSLLLLGYVSFLKGETQETIRFAQQGLAISQKSKLIGQEMIANVVLSLGYGDLNNDQKAMEAAQAFLAITRKSQSPKYEKTALTLLGNIHRKFGRTQEAIQAYNQALAIKIPAKTVGENSGTYAGLARIYRDLNKPNVAIAYYKDAINSIEEVRRSVEGLTPEIQKSFLNATVDFNRVKTADVYKELADLLIKQGQEAEAQGRKDDAQAQQVMDLIKIQEVKDFARNITGKPQLPLANVEKQIQTGNQTVIALAGKIRECERTKCQQLSQLNDQLTALLQETNRKLKEIDKEIGDRLSNDPSAFRPNSPKPQEVVKAQPNTIMIYPFVREEKLWLLTYFDKGRMVIEVPVTRKELDNQVKEFRKLMEECEKRICGSAEIAKIKPVSQKLYTWLIKPLESELETNKVKNLVFALDSAVRYIPMSALFNGDRYLIENYTIYNVFSSDLTNTTDKFPLNPSVLAMGLSDAAPPKFGSLPNVPQELNAIAKTNTRDKGIYPRSFLNNNFTFLTLRDHLAGHNILHLATHGEFVPGKRDASYILSGTKEKISIPEIETLTGLSEVHLVVLSACQTALASSLQDGVEIASVAYYFLNGGAKSVMASLWQVADRSTAETMQNFYKYLRTSRQPITKAEGLRMAQLSLLYSKEVTLEDIKRGGIIPEGIPGKPTKNQTSRTTYAHPYYWAPFILIGNGL